MAYNYMEDFVETAHFSASHCINLEIKYDITLQHSHIHCTSNCKARALCLWKHYLKGCA